jgi:iron complex transport system permease protein
LFVLPLALVCTIVLFALRWRLNLLTLQDDLLRSLGHDPRRMRIVVLIAAVGATAAVTALAGVIAWVGLIVPYIARSVFGNDNAKVLPASGLIGAILMMVFDDIARTVAPGEIPLGVVASVLCVPIFVLMLARRQPNA